MGFFKPKLSEVAYSIHKIEGEQLPSIYTITARLMEEHMKGYWEATEKSIYLNSTWACEIIVSLGTLCNYQKLFRMPYIEQLLK